MSIEATVERIRACGVIVVVRAIHEDTLARTVEAILEGGVDCVEIAMSVRGALRDISVLKQQWGDRIVIGAADVLNAEMAILASSADADFCSGVAANAEMIRACNQHDIVGIPGALTPTEVHSAWHAGAGLVKLFPADLVGPRYLETVRRPLSRVELIPSGGITPQNVGEFIAAGAFAVGAGRAVVDPALVAAGNFAQVTRNAAALREAVTAAREQCARGGASC